MEVREASAGMGRDVDAMAAAADGKFMSAFIRATKPQSAQ